MNKEYIKEEDKVIVRDEKGDISVYEYQDNIEDILIKENIIEELESKKSELLLEKEDILKSRNMPKFLRYLCYLSPITIGLIVPIFLIPVSIDMFNIPEYAASIMERIAAIDVTILGLPLTAMTIGGFIEEQRMEKHERGVDLQLKILNNKLEGEKSLLVDLKSTKKSEKQIELSTPIKVNCKEELKELKRHLNTYYDCGYNAEKYYDYYQEKGALPNKLTNNYTPSEQELVKTYLEEQGPVLVKSKFNRNKK